MLLKIVFIAFTLVLVTVITIKLNCKRCNDV